MYDSRSPATIARPARLLLLAALCGLVAIALIAWFMLQQPWLGITFLPDHDRVIAASVAPHLTADLPHGSTVSVLSTHDGSEISLRPQDLIEEPDFFDSYVEMNKFFDRQTAISAMLRNNKIRLHFIDRAGAAGETELTPRLRPLTTLPMVFWFQLFCGFAGLLISLWVFALRPHDWGTRMFLATGISLALATTTAAIYSTRELAIPGETIRLLSGLNHMSTSMFGSALVALFLVYPRRLVRLRTLIVIPAVFMAWWVADVLQIAPDMDWGTRVPVMLEMLLAVIFGLVQWRKSQQHPLDRASLRWFALSALAGCSMFVLTVVVPNSLKLFEPLSQGYAFGFFLIMYIGIALGLGRYRLFDLDIWAYRVLLWVGGATLVVIMDAALIMFGLGEATSLGLTLLLCGWLYFPLRQWLWQWIANHRTPDFDNLLPELSAIAFTASHDQQVRWKALLQRIFDPLELVQNDTQDSDYGVREDGLGMHVPACGNLPEYLMRHAGYGTRLFSTRDAEFTASLGHLLEQIMSGRTSYEQGVAQERLRIGRDLHDNIGARLLKLIHHLRGTANADIARDAMKDLRTAIAAMDSQPVPLLNALGDWRAEANSRCEAAGCQLHWQQPYKLPEVQLTPRTKAMLESVMRELVTNALKHATPDNIKIQVDADATQLQVSISNDGNIAEISTWKDGYGLRNIRGRMDELGGSLNISAIPGEVLLSIKALLV